MAVCRAVDKAETDVLIGKHERLCLVERRQRQKKRGDGLCTVDPCSISSWNFKVSENSKVEAGL